MFTFRSKLIFLLLTLFMCGTSMGQQRQDILAPKVFKNARDETLLYRLFVPANYDRKRNIRWCFICTAVVGAARTT